MRAPVTDLPIVLEDVSFSAGGVTILERISLALVVGPPTVLIGPNGAGKTTLLRLIMGLIPPTRGRVTWGGREHAASKHRAIVFQRPTMLRRSAAGNIRYALAAAGVPRARRAAHALELRLHARLPRNRKSSCSTSRPQASIRPRPRRSRTSSARSPRAASRW